MANRNNDDLPPLPEPATNGDDGGWGPWLRRNLTRDNIRFAIEMIILLAASLGIQQGCEAKKESQNNSIKIDQVKEHTEEKIKEEAEKTRKTVTGMRNPLGKKDE